ncbi:hypothetical protein CLV92_11697 [Kineococcus xinjiangensis]|uniref:Uncharacterized protein n=1 Tax=Kineococcus xinjiangensis TaxID=512762 RepID=A0A2S6IDE2_9ACTN|nr:hypothetical protein [Kineococcus xinjiangensis]PPK92235.1 hypothetical protein CLV92_11697 [Kineococcus xinjiangensis]
MGGDEKAGLVVESLLARIAELEPRTVGAEALEPDLQALADYLADHREAWPAIKRRFVRLLREYPPGTTDVMQFCMYRFQWPEIEQTARQLLVEATDHRLRRAYEAVLEVYTLPWEDRDIYRAYRAAEPRTS